MKRERVHAPALEWEIAEHRARGADEVAGWFEALLANTPGAGEVRDWFKKHARSGVGELLQDMHAALSAPELRNFAKKVRPGIGELHGELSPLISIEDWEAEIRDLVFYQFKRFVPVSKRELIPQDQLDEKTLAMANKARALASDLEQLGSWCPSVLAFFDDERAVDIIRALPPALAIFLLINTGYSTDRGDGYQRIRKVIPGIKSWGGPAENLAREFGDQVWPPNDNSPTPQLFPSLLRRLAAYIEENAAQPSTRLPRKKQPDRTQSPKKKPKKTTSEDADWANSRAFARELARFFMDSYGERPWAVMAALVSIRFPDMEDPPDDRTIRGLFRNRSKK